MKDPARERTQSAATSNNNSKSSTRQGIQLLSPTFQQSITLRNSTDNSLASSRTAGNKAPGSSRTDRVASFDFDSFTLESVRATSICSNIANKSDKPNNSNNNSIAVDNNADIDAECARKPSFPSQQQFAVPISAPRTKSTHGGAALNTSTSNVRMSGWLQKRKGVVLKRWKAYFCLLKRDDHLCLYASEDTVNGRLEQRIQVLRVLLTDASDVFHVIGVGADGAPRKDEFRTTHSVDWRDWFLGFRDLLDAVSLQGAVARKPELALLPSPSSLPTMSYRSHGSMDDAGDSGDSHSSSGSSQHQRVHSYAVSSNDRRSTLHSKHQMREFLDKYPESDHFGSRSTMSAFSVASTTSTNQSSSDDDAVGSSNNHHDLLQSRHTAKGGNSATSQSDCSILEGSCGSGSTARSSDASVVKASAFSW
ncbi:hypothetical protein FI667_g16550, partial [Globisporangium splendens]